MSGQIDSQRSSEDPVLTVVLMTYNEGETLAEVAAELLNTMGRLPCRSELLIVNDGSTDGSTAIAERLAGERPGVRVVHHEANRGLGEVYRSGFSCALGRYITFFPADGQFPSEIVDEFLVSMESADLVLGYLEKRPGVPIARALSALERTLYRLLLGPMPRFQGIFMLRRDVLDQFRLASKGRGWGIVMEMILRVHRGGYRVVSKPTGYRPRRTGQSKATTGQAIMANLRQILELRKILQNEPWAK